MNIKRMVLYAFLMNAALAALASFLISPIDLAKFSNGETLGSSPSLRPSSAALTDRGALRRSDRGDQQPHSHLLTTEYRAALPLVLLIVIILWRPQGLLGVDEGRKV